MKVLLAYRSPALCAEVTPLFAELGWTLLTADDGLKAERLLRTEHPDVAILEAGMDWPGEGSLVEHVKCDSDLKRIRVVMVCDDLDLERALGDAEAGVDHVIVPVTAAELAIRVNAAAQTTALEARLDDQWAEVRGLVHADPLTGLLDRRFLARQLAAQVNNARRHRHPLSVLLIDLDRLKEINDTLGHAAGDEALRAVGQVLEERLRDGDIAGRWGGDEFVVILPATGADAAMTVARDLVESVATLTTGPTKLTLSVGCAQWHEEDPPALLQRADRALYAAKQAGRNDAALAAIQVVDIPVPDTAALATNSGLRVLLVDDVGSIRSLLRVTLEGLGMEIVGEASSGDEAVQMARRTEPDAVVMDWNMPGVDGIQATRELLAVVPDTVVAAFTSTDDPRIHRALLGAGATAHFNKRDLGPLMEFLAEVPVAGVHKSDPGAV